MNGSNGDLGSTKNTNQIAASQVATIATTTAPKITLPHMVKL
jgi:hypothetical protein